MKKGKNILLALLVAALLLTLVGCKKDKAEEAQEPVQSVTEVPEVEEEPLKPIDESILMPEASVL